MKLCKNVFRTILQLTHSLAREWSKVYFGNHTENEPRYTLTFFEEKSMKELKYLSETFHKDAP